MGSYVARLRGRSPNGLPAYVGLPAAQSVYLFPGYQGAAYLGQGYSPFDVNRQQKYLGATETSKIQDPKFLENSIVDVRRIESRVGLLAQLDHLRRDLDRSGVMEAMDHFQQEAVDLILGERARQAFDIERETPDTRDRYGRGPWGHYTLMARRLVEAGQVIGATNARGEYPVEYPVTPADLLATIYQVLGIDPNQTFLDHSGRPVPILDSGVPIRAII